MKRILGFSILLPVVMLLLFPGSAFSRASVRIGILEDGPYENNRALVSDFKRELAKLNNERFKILYPEDAVLNGNYDPAKIRSHARFLSEKRNLDVVVAMGTESTKALSAIASLRIPVVSVGCDFPVELGIIDPATLKPANPNLTLRYDPSIEKRIATMMGAMITQKKITWLCPRFLYEQNREISDIIAAVSRRIGIEIVPLVVTAEDYREKIDAVETGAVFAPWLYGFDGDAIKALYETLADRKILSINVDARLGAMMGACISLAEEDFRASARDLALSVYSIMDGGTPSEMPVMDNWPLAPVFNAATAERIGYAVPLTFRYDATLVGKETPMPTLTLSDALATALNRNLDIAARIMREEQAEHRVSRTRGGYLPQLETNLAYSRIDKTRADLTPSPRGETTVELALAQTLYDRRLSKAVESARMGVEVEEKERRSIEQDVMAATAIAYFNYMEAEEVVGASRRHLIILRKNREIAKLRFEAGDTGKTDVLRMEIQYDQTKVDLVNATDRRNAALASLLNLLDLPDKPGFELGDRDEFSRERFSQRQHLFERYFRSSESLDVIEGFFKNEAMTRSTELAAIDARLSQAEVERERIKGKFWPNFQFRGSAFRQLGDDHRSFAPPTAGFDESKIYEDGNEDGWSAQLTMNLPLYTGGTRLAELRENKALIGELEFLRKKIESDISRDISVAGHAHYVARNNTALSIRDVALARENLELSEISYRHGEIGIMDLLDTQEQKILTEIRAISSRFSFHRSLVDMFRAVSYVELLREGRGSPEAMKMTEALKKWVDEKQPGMF